MKGLQKQRGVALIIVFMIVAIVVVIATDMGSRLQIQIQRAANLKDNNQAYWYAMGAEAFARKSIKTIFDETGDKIVITQPWSQKFTYPLDNGGIEAQLEDAQSCFNLNALGESDDNSNQSSATQTTEAMEAFGRMLEATGDNIDNYTAETVRDSLADWLDSDTRMRTYGAEDSEYESREHPYLAANSLMTNQSELRLINGVSPVWLNAILPLVCVLPEDTALAINVNTLTEERAAILAGLTGLDMSQATSLISSRPQDGWADIDSFLGEPVLAALDLSDEQRSWFTVTTGYFILHTKTSYNKATFSLSTLFKAQGGENVSVIRREFGGVK
ncbi:type II secretion system minor pseudopilin GspK [Alteromonas sp. 1_MG-2023]|uniref:type II secretion system minor pseudopilin GspK n=1 Tax=Alteromonas sp. 1_MG-2023 TaxID=3062669 RepID=UPI0026E3056C|nr:type II secretion system minor pseudopilin GspK [Alteromonas sp. 1_MG-2023]MDO6474247.1 type II secretion system minor pseudopilin GspK [Alteromonas sp. 1_MG-2023]